MTTLPITRPVILPGPNRGVYIMGGGLKTLGFTYASDDIIMHPQILPYSPVNLHFTKAGFNLRMGQDLSQGRGL